MKHILIAAGLLLATANAASAKCDAYGNCYSSNGYGGVQGYNSRTGSSWTTQTQPGGSSRGVDSRGNSWTYDRPSGLYNNYGTGQSRQNKPCYTFNCR